MRLGKRFISIIMVIAMMMTCICISATSAFAASGSMVYFDNSNYNWEKVYIYAYGTKENAEWPGELMTKGEDGLYTATFPATYTSENIIFNNGLEKGEGKEQYPENAGLPLKAGECKLFTNGQWISYGQPDDTPCGFAYEVDKDSSADYISVKLGLKNATEGEYSIDGATRVAFSNGKVIKIGQGKIANKKINLDLFVDNNGEEVKSSFTYEKTFSPSQTYFSSNSDGHTTEPITGHYSTNPNMQLGKNKTITIDGQVDDWDSSMIIAQGVANDDPRVYMPSSMHEQPWDAYALYSAWDDDNLYFMWEMTNTTYIVSPSDNFAASNEARPWRNSIPIFLALSIDPTKKATGKAVGTDKAGNTFTNPFVWGCDGGVAKDGGASFTTNIDTLIAMDSNNSNGGDSIFKADTLDTDGTYMFNYDTAVKIGVRNYQAQDNQNGFKIKYANGTKSESIIGINAPKGSRTVGDNLLDSSNWVDFKDLGYKDNYGFIYEVAIPLSTLGIDKEYIETKGIGAMQILTYGTSGMDTLPFDPSMHDNADVEYSYDPSTSHEKEDVDNITVPLARIGALLDDTVVNEAPLEVNFGADLSSGQAAGTDITLLAEEYNNKGDVEFEFAVDGNTLQKSNKNSVVWTPSKEGTYEISVKAKDAEGRTAEAVKTFTVGVPSEELKPGDVSGDGVVDISDARLVQKYTVKLINLYESQLKAADVNGDGKVTVADVTTIQKMIAGLIA